MATPAEPFAEAAQEAAQTAAATVRLVLAIADAVRRSTEERAGKQTPPPPADQSKDRMAGLLRAYLEPDIATAVITSPDWPTMAQQLWALDQAGVDVGALLPRVGEIAVTVRDAIQANAERTARDGTQEWARLLRETMPAGPVRQAVLSSPTWPDIAAAMAQLHQQGVDVRRILLAAHHEGAGVDQAIGRAMEAAAAPPATRDALRSSGPLTIGLDIPPDLDLGDRRRAMEGLGIDPAENTHAIRTVQEALGPELRQEAALLISRREWPLLAARIVQMGNEGRPAAAHLARLGTDRAWQQGPPGELAQRLLRAASEALHKPPPAAGEGFTAAPVSTIAARAQSTTAGPTIPPTAGTAPTEPAPAPAATQKQSPRRGR